MPGPALSRRSLLLGVGLTITLSGCGIRLEDDAPDIPLVPRRRPIPGESALLAMVTSLSNEPQDASVPRGLGDGRAAELMRALEELGVPEAETSRAFDAPLSWSEAEDVAVYEGALRECPKGLLALVGSLSIARVLRGPARLWSEEGGGAWETPEAARAIVADTRAAVWTLTVVAAKAGERERSKVQAVVTGLQDLLSRQVVAGDDDGSDAPMGYDLDASTATAQDRAQLVRTTLARLVNRQVVQLGGLDADRDAAHEIVSWAATVLRLGGPWRLALDALPGFED